MGDVPRNYSTINDLKDRTPAPKELYSFTKDVSDYAWYSTSIKLDARDLPMRPDVRPGLHIASLGHALLAFVNGEYVGFEHGSNVEKSHIFRKPVNLKPGDNDITLLAMTVGFPNSGAYMEKRFAGPRAVTLEGLMSGTLDITNNQWVTRLASTARKSQFTQKKEQRQLNGSPSLEPLHLLLGTKTYFDAPEGTNPVALRMMSMAKGMVWVNGQSIGRYWGHHLQRYFGIPPPSVRSWERKGDGLRALVNPVREAELTCPDNKVIKKVEFVGFGEVDGACEPSSLGNATPMLRLSKLLNLVLGEERVQGAI
ncbi:UNVERIFIED_CONTAM: Beta-galactosidase 13 [Sesamum latifolium]|uniref:Beta-galactosidase 13 n=1 Tax=Sesamum latifolium TaxID=2727402 RepID=A0AAW2XLR4_9LAMI